MASRLEPYLSRDDVIAILEVLSGTTRSQLPGKFTTLTATHPASMMATGNKISVRWTSYADLPDAALHEGMLAFVNGTLYAAHGGVWKVVGGGGVETRLAAIERHLGLPTPP